MESGKFDPFADIHNLTDAAAWPDDKIKERLTEKPAWESPRKKKAVSAPTVGYLIFEGLSRKAEARGYKIELDTSKDPAAINPSKIAQLFHDHPEVESLGDAILFMDQLSQQSANEQ